MWIPGSASEITKAVLAGELQETAIFDAKAALPASGKRNVDLAVDVAAMTTDGGVLLYGVAEDENKRLIIPAPFPLAGAPERVDQIVSTSIAEVPRIHITTFPTDDDPSVGYLHVLVPRSDRAPHQVLVGNDSRFYGRGAVGNRRLNEHEIALLYQRRLTNEVDRRAAIETAIRTARFEPDPALGFLYAYCQPSSPDSRIWDSAAKETGSPQKLVQSVTMVAAKRRTQQEYSPNFAGARAARLGADTWRVSSVLESEVTQGNARYAVEFTVSREAQGLLFCGRIAEDMQRSNWDTTVRRVVFEDIVAGNLAGFLAGMGALFEAGGYYGQVDVGLRLTGLQGVVSYGRINDLGVRPYEESTFERHSRVAASELSQPQSVVRSLLGHLFEALSGDPELDPFLPQRPK